MLRWDHRTEDLTDEGVSTEMVERIRAGGPLSPRCLTHIMDALNKGDLSIDQTVFAAGLRDLDQGLGAYPYDTLKKWISLSNHISQDLVTR